MISSAVVFLGAGIGGVLRHGVNLLAGTWLGAGFPFGTLVINVAGSGLMGLVAGWFMLKGGAGTPGDLRLFLATGVLGGFTTFSAFSLDAVLLWQRGDVMLALAYVFGSVALSIAALIGGLAIIRGLV